MARAALLRAAFFAASSEVEVIFTKEGSKTRVDLEHRLLERYGNKAEEMQKAFDSPNGWNGMLQAFGAKVSES